MATLLARGFDDVLTDNLVAIASYFATEQAALAAGANFTADRDLMSPPDAEALKASPWMVFSVDGIQPGVNRGGQNAKQYAYTVTVDLYAAEGGNDDESDKAAKARLSYLKEQAMAVMDSHRWPQFSKTGVTPVQLEVGTVGNRRFCRILFLRRQPTTANRG